MERQIKQRLDKELNDDQKATLKKLSPAKIMKLAKASTRIYNNSCEACKRYIIRHAKSMKFEDFCDFCKQNKKLQSQFRILAELNGSVKND